MATTTLNGSEYADLERIKGLVKRLFDSVRGADPKDVAAALTSATLYAMREANVPAPLAVEIVRTTAIQIDQVEQLTGLRGFSALEHGCVVMSFTTEPVGPASKSELKN